MTCECGKNHQLSKSSAKIAAPRTLLISRHNVRANMRPARFIAVYKAGLLDFLGDALAAFAGSFIEAVVRVQDQRARWRQFEEEVNRTNFETSLQDAVLKPLADEVDPAWNELVRESAGIAYDDQAKSLGFNLAFGGGFHPSIGQWARENGGRRITMITDDTRKQIMEIVRDGLDEGRNPKDMAKFIRPLIGLNAPQQRAIMNLIATMQNEGVSQARINQMIERMTNKKLKERAELIARTEAITATAVGTEAAWRQSQSQGLLPTTGIQKRWIAAIGSSRTCPLCISLHGQEVPVGQPFSRRGVEYDNPPAHPGCRCSMGLVEA